MIKSILQLSITLCLSLIASTSLLANNSPAKSSIFDQMYQDKVLEISIKTDIDELITNKNSDEYQPAVFVYKNEQGVEQDHLIKLKARGKYRRRVCDFPPIKIKFSKDQLKKAGLSKHNDLKLVTHCLDNKLEGNANVFKEYMAYKMYNIITPNSFRVQLVKITYLDDQSRNRKMKRYGFLIEDTDEMAERLGGEECEDCRGLQKKDMDVKTYNQLAAFEYMIGNEDWSIQMLKNVKVVIRKDGSKIAVPYDFDFSGFVNTSYAVPSTDHNHTTLTERAWLGDCVSMPELFQVKMNFEHCEHKFYRMIDNFKLLEEEDQLEMKNYIGTFYAEKLVNIASCQANEKPVPSADELTKPE